MREDRARRVKEQIHSGGNEKETQHEEVLKGCAEGARSLARGASCLRPRPSCLHQPLAVFGGGGTASAVEGVLEDGITGRQPAAQIRRRIRNAGREPFRRLRLGLVESAAPSSRREVMPCCAGMGGRGLSAVVPLVSARKLPPDRVSRASLVREAWGAALADLERACRLETPAHWCCRRDLNPHRASVKGRRSRHLAYGSL